MRPMGVREVKVILVSCRVFFNSEVYLTFSLPHLLLMLLDNNWHLIFKSQLSTHLYFVKKFDLRRSHGQVELCRGGAGQ